MTDQEMRIAIAEAVGIPVNVCMCGNLEESHCIGRNEHTFTPMCDELPDYLNDLNAMASAEDTLSDEQWDIYSTWLCITTDYKTSRIRAHELIRAKACQRAEAFLRTIGKWRDG